MGKYRKVKSLRNSKSSYGRGFNESMICLTNKPEAQTAIVEINKGYNGTYKMIQND